jgi:hypothetical protein
VKIHANFTVPIDKIEEDNDKRSHYTLTVPNYEVEESLKKIS